ncbi:uncharacterized protein OCT59_018260 [Rhizophagus irregularis]|uniref:uncharacterized protein n=1 Tax=Rhizophagus irregularis TaxID=588596 RepID=UPI000CB08C6D|nr:hypothetical protein OCT59_018260 [Rhizophagus irregularis]GBC41966.1 hypothetical protein GLOIN_2v1875525 [Rhizophagus irregularis DAOM 181602=DAOM 197198]
MNYILKKEVKSTSYFYYFFRFIKSFDDTITNNPSNETSNDVKNDKDNGVNKDNSIDKDNGINKDNGESNSNGLSNNERSQKVKHWAQYRKDKKRLHKGKLLSVKENLRLFERPPEKSSTY